MVAAAVALGLGIGLLGESALRAEVLLALPLVVLVGKAIGLYERDPHRLQKGNLDEVPELFQAATLYTLVIWLLDEFVATAAIGAPQAAALWGIVFLAMVAARRLARALVRAWTPPERCIVVGDTAAADRLQKKFEESTRVNATIVGRIPFEAFANGRRALHPERDVEVLGAMLAEDRIERVIVVPGPSDTERLLDMVRLVRVLGTKVSVLPGFLEVIGSSVEFDDVDGLPLLGVRSELLPRSSRILKRGMDLVGAAAGLLVLAAVLCATAAAVKLTSRGPALFRQKRIGRGGEEFELIKFRTMVEGADERKAELLHLNETDGIFKMADDPRLTRVGRLLRRSYIDELPQLVNVLRGEMSLVGPRPLVPDEDRRVEGWHRRRLAFKPGLTGPWQLLGPMRVPLEEMVKIDYLYGANWSLWEDLKTLIRTVSFVLSRPGL